MRVSYASGYYAPIPEGHIFPMKKFEGLYRYLTQQGIVDSDRVISPSPAHYSTLLKGHTPTYLDGILHGNLTYKEERRLGLPWSPGLATRSQLAVQGTINASLMALQDGISGNLAGGTHHAFPDHGEGFCVFNDVAIAIQTLKEAMWISKVLIVDCDVHQGNGTAYYFKDDPSVFTFSIHGEKNYPFKKQPSSLDIGLPDKTGDQEYLKTLEHHLSDVLTHFSPDIVYYLGGIDVLEEDHFGRISLSTLGLKRREELVLSILTEQQFPIVLLLSGGYAPTLEKTVLAHAEMFRTAKLLLDTRY